MVTSRLWFTAKQKSELWERWKNGQSVLAISQALERRNNRGSPWRDRAGATPQSCGGVEA